MADNICQTCLSKNRKLIPQRSLLTLVENINLCEVANKEGGICWECHYLLRRFSKFKAQVKRAQESLRISKFHYESLSNLGVETKNYYDHQFYYSDPLVVETKTEIEVKEEQTLSDDDTSTNGVFKYTKCSRNIDELDTNSVDDDGNDDIAFDDTEKQIKTEKNVLPNKCPLNIDVLDTNDDDNEEIAFEDTEKTIKFEKNVLVSDKNKQKKVKLKKKAGVEDVEGKYLKVLFTVEEMLKNRDEKRNHPNYKKCPLKCDTCVLGFLRKDKFDSHMEQRHSESIGDYICDVCQIRFSNLGRIARHCHKHFEVYRCKLCKYETIEIWAIVKHCRAKHRIDRIDRIHCLQCDWVAKTPRELTEHNRAEHSLRCEECGEKFKHHNSLKKHIVRIHGEDRVVSCNICNRTFVNKTRLETHMATHNDALARKLAYCAECDVQYKNIYIYRSHLKNSTNHAARLYECPDCNKTFASKQYWNTHYTFYHLQKSKYKCDICNKLFISEWRLKNHKQVNHGLSRPRDHACNICGKKFFTSAILRGHMYTHSEQRRFMCEDCGDTFKQRPALYTHTRLVHHVQKKKTS